MAYLVPDDQLIETIASGHGIRQASIVQPVNKEFYNDTLALIPFDIEKAKQLLTAAGWVDTDSDNIRDKMINGKKVPFRFQFTYRASESNKQMALMIKDAMYKAVDPAGTPIFAGKEEFAKALGLIKDGKPIRYEGVIGPVAFDKYGDITGPFQLWPLDAGKVTTDGEMTTDDVNALQAKLQ